MTLQPAQQLTDAQRSAIRSACRGDYQQVCANVPTGTKDSLQCLLQHSQQVSPACREALAPAASATSGTAAAASSASAPAPAAAAH
jgi:Cysteine rich repeat